MTRSPVKRRRAGPPRKGRVVDEKFMAFVAETYPCILAQKHICGGRLTLHHDKECPGAPKNDRRVVPLCEAAHQHQAGPESVERLGKRKFQERWDVDFEATIRQQNEEYENEMGMKVKAAARELRDSLGDR